MFLPARAAWAPCCSQRTAPDPGLFNFLLAKFYAKAGDAERAAHYLKLSRDYGYKEFRSAEKDPEFASVIKDPRVQEVLKVPPSYEDQPQDTVSQLSVPPRKQIAFEVNLRRASC